jgi:WD40 repeat protein
MQTLNNVNFVNDLFSNVAANFPMVFERDAINLSEIDHLQDIHKPSCVLYRKLSGHSKSIIAACLSSTGKYMWSGDTKGAFRIWNTQTTELVSSYDTSVNRINCMTRAGQKILLGTSQPGGATFEVGVAMSKVINDGSGGKLNVEAAVTGGSTFNFPPEPSLITFDIATPTSKVAPPG